MRILVMISLVCVFHISCTSQKYGLDNLPEKQLVFGSGGGITGEVKSYTLLENGQLFSHNSLTKEDLEMKGVSKKEAQEYFKSIMTLNLAKADFNHPGNLYYFLEEVNGEENYRVTWGSNNHEISEEYKALYKELKSIIN